MHSLHHKSHSGLVLLAFLKSRHKELLLLLFKGHFCFLTKLKNFLVFIHKKKTTPGECSFFFPAKYRCSTVSAWMDSIIHNLQLNYKMIQKYKIRRLECIILFRKIPFLNLPLSTEHGTKLRLAQTHKAVLWQSCSTKVKINTVGDQKLKVVICRSSTSSIISYLSAFFQMSHTIWLPL